MNAITLRAHYDGQKIVLDEQFKMKPNTKLIVTVLPEIDSEHPTDVIQEERSAWLKISVKGFGKVFDENEVEYSLDLIKKPNPDYEGR